MQCHERLMPAGYALPTLHLLIITGLLGFDNLTSDKLVDELLCRIQKKIFVSFEDGRDTLRLRTARGVGIFAILTVVRILGVGKIFGMSPMPTQLAFPQTSACLEVCIKSVTVTERGLTRSSSLYVDKTQCTICSLVGSVDVPNGTLSIPQERLSFSSLMR